MKINEIYLSIQGESSYAGLPCVFVRLTYCNLRCTYCDTEYAFYEGKDMTVDDVIASVLSYDCPLVEVTGGEPLLQKEVFPLMDRLIDSGRTVLLETGRQPGYKPGASAGYQDPRLEMPEQRRITAQSLWESGQTSASR